MEERALGITIVVIGLLGLIGVFIEYGKIDVDVDIEMYSSVRLGKSQSGTTFLISSNLFSSSASFP